MRHALYLAIAYLRHHPLKTAILILAISLILAMPLATRLILNKAETLLSERAASTPLVIGAKGSALDVLMNALYFTEDRPNPIPFDANEEIWESGYAIPVPIFHRFTAQNHPLIGTTLDYFDMRQLSFDEGRPFAIMGEAVIGASVAENLDLGVGDVILSDPVNLFDLAGSYPLLMTVSGVLAETGGIDDRAVFTDIKTTWVIEGIGHGHKDLETTPEMILLRDGNEVIANAGVQLYNEITAGTAASFHFHGDQAEYPITAVLAFPPDQRSSAILQGRFVFPEIEEQMIVPQTVIADLLQTVFKISRILDGVILAAMIAAILAIGLVIYLSLKLRQEELATVFKLGGRRLTVLRLVLAEMGLVLVTSMVIATLALGLVTNASETLARWLLGAI